VVEELSHEEVTQCVDRAVEDLLTAAGVMAPPVDAIALAQRHLGLVVAVEGQPPRGRGSGSGSSSGSGKGRRGGVRNQVVLSPETSKEQQQWAVARATGESLRPSMLERLGFDPALPRPLMGVSLADLFARRLLAPTAWFAHDAPSCSYDLDALKARYPTASHEVLAWRLLDLPEPCIITVVDDNQVYRRRSNAWPVKKHLEPAEQECQRYVSEHGEPHRVSRGAWTVRGWPVHHEDWKREILRSVVDPSALDEA
jgi:hypothetical protein